MSLMKSTARATRLPLLPAARGPAVLTMDEDAKIMWEYCRAHKRPLIADIRVYQTDVLAQPMAGGAVEGGLAPFFKPAEPASRMCRAA